MNKKEYPIITIGRQIGSGGLKIGKILSEKMEIPCYDKEVIALASQETGLGKEFFENADEKSNPKFWGTFFGSDFFHPHTKNYLCNEMLFKLQSDVIRDLADKGACIFVGRCADYILRDYPKLIRIFIHADMEERIRRIAADRVISEKEAKNMIEQTDKSRAAYYNYYSNKIWGMASSYDLSINSSVSGIEGAAEYIFQFLSRIA